MDLSEVLVVNFAVKERTIELSEYCIKKLGFSNVVTLQSNDGFRQKFLKFVDIALETNAKCFLRTDADRLLFDGTIDMVTAWFSNQTLQCVEGQCFDFLMNKYRGATPHLFSREALIKLKENPGLMPDSQKPESRFIENITENKASGWIGIPALTNLHDYEQYPSKVCNTIVNRISRGHLHYLYDPNYISTLDEKYQIAFAVAQQYVAENGTKKRMNYLDFSFLDSATEPIDSRDISEKYKSYKLAYKTLILNR